MASVLSYSLCQTIEVTRLCENVCPFCPYPYTSHEPLLSLARIRKGMKRGLRLGAVIIELRSGSNPTLYPEILSALKFYHCNDYLDYLNRAAMQLDQVRQNQPVVCRLNVGPQGEATWKKLELRYHSQSFLLPAPDPLLKDGLLEQSPTHQFEHRLEKLVELGEANCQVQTGILVGLGERREYLEKGIKILAGAARRYGHIQSVRLQAFRPHQATPFYDQPPTSFEEIGEAVALARRYMPPAIRIQINALDWTDHLVDLAEAGANDLGDLELNVLSKGNQAPEMEVELLLEPLRKKGYTLRFRKPLQSRHILMQNLPPTAGAYKPER